MAAIAPVNLGALNFKQCFADILVGSVFYIFLLALDFKSLCNSKNKPHAILYNIKILNMPCSDQTSQVSEIIYLKRGVLDWDFKAFFCIHEIRRYSIGIV